MSRVKPGNPYYALYTRAVLPDEIDGNPVEPSPGEGLVERVAALLSAQGGASFPWAELRPDTKGIWLNRARAVLAEIAKDEKVSLSEWERQQKRVSELEAAITRGRAAFVAAGVGKDGDSFLQLALGLEVAAEQFKSDLATVTRERDERAVAAESYASRLGDALLERDSLARELAEAKRDEHSACERGNRLAQELAEAKQMYERMLAESNADCTRQCERANAAEAEAKALSEQAARHKVDEAHADHVTIELQRELAEAREELLNANNAGRGPRPTNPYNREEEAAYRVGRQNGADTIEAWHRVVRVEPEKAHGMCREIEHPANALAVKALEAEGVKVNRTARDFVPAFHDGGGERPGQVKCDQDDCPGHATPEERPCRWEPGVSKEPDDGPPRAGDVVRIDEVHRDSYLFSQAKTLVGRVVTLTNIVEGPETFDGWPAYEFDGKSCACRVTVLRRAGQPTPKAVLPIDAEDERVVDALVHRRTADRAETPLLGPHAGTVADHGKLIKLLTEWVLCPASREPLERMIRAERAGSKTNDERTETDSF